MKRCGGWLIKAFKDRRTTCQPTPILVQEVHARESRKGAMMEKENPCRAESLSFREHGDLSVHRRLRVIRLEHAEHASTTILPQPTDSEDDMECMVLLEAATKWLKQHGLEGFLRIVEAPPHGDVENILKDIDTEVITEEAI